jgi:hypothetical protein
VDVVFLFYLGEGGMHGGLVDFEIAFFCRSLVAVGGRRDCKVGSQRRGIEDWKSARVGRTAC